MKRNDRHDLDPTEAKLIRIGNHLMGESRRAGLTSDDKSLFREAAELVWCAKADYRIELAEKRRLAGEPVVLRMRGRRGA